MLATLRAYWYWARDQLWILCALLLPIDKRVHYLKPSPRVHVPIGSPPPLFRQWASGTDPLQAWKSRWYNHLSIAQVLATLHPEDPRVREGSASVRRRYASLFPGRHA